MKLVTLSMFLGFFCCNFAHADLNIYSTQNNENLNNENKEAEVMNDSEQVSIANQQSYQGDGIDNRDKNETTNQDEFNNEYTETKINNLDVSNQYKYQNNNLPAVNSEEVLEEQLNKVTQEVTLNDSYYDSIMAKLYQSKNAEEVDLILDSIDVHKLSQRERSIILRYVDNIIPEDVSGARKEGEDHTHIKQVVIISK